MSIPIVDAADFAKETAEGIVLVDFFTPTCGPCRQMVPILEQCAEFVRVIKVDASANLDLSSSMGIRAVPTLVFYKDGSEVKRVTGVHGKADIQQIVGDIQ